MTRLLLVCMVVGAIGAACATPANATPMSYLQALNDNGIDVTDTTDALTMGYTACSMLDYGNGTQVSQMLWERTDIPQRWMADVLVVAAVEQLCPRHDHRGEATSARRLI